MATMRAAQRDRDAELQIEDRDRLDEPFASVRVRLEHAGARVVCRAEWGGWSWRAEGRDPRTARERLNRRLARLDPFLHADDDWGGPGYQVAELDPVLPPSTRERMRDYTQREARSAVGLLEAVFEAQARRPWAFPALDAPAPEGIEIEGYVAGDGSLVVFPRTFYDIANAYFGRALPHSATGRQAGPGPDAGDQANFAGALRRLNERGYMRSGDGKLGHQLRPIEVYVFTADPQPASFS
jgi:hypothetical protein